MDLCYESIEEFEYLFKVSKADVFPLGVHFAKIPFHKPWEAFFVGWSEEFTVLTVPVK